MLFGGNLTGNLSVLASHAWLKNQLTTYNDAQVANVVKVFLAKKITDETAKTITTKKKQNGILN